MIYAKKLLFWLTRKNNYEQIQNEIIPNKTIVSAMPWSSVRYRGVIDEKGIFQCWGRNDGLAIMGIPINKCYNIQIENMQERQSVFVQDNFLDPVKTHW